jgi:PII-like signaling protein
MTSLQGPALRLTVYVGENDRVHHRPLYSEIVHRAHAAGLAGASVFRGIEGFGASSRIHTSRILSLSEDLPITIVLIDARERIEAFLPELEELVQEGLVVVDGVHVVRYVGRAAGPEAAGDGGAGAGSGTGRGGGSGVGAGTGGAGA